MHRGIGDLGQAIWLLREGEAVMAACEKCWEDAGGYADRYYALVKSRECTPEQQAGTEAGRCLECGRKTVHQPTHACVVCGRKR